MSTCQLQRRRKPAAASCLERCTWTDRQTLRLTTFIRLSWSPLCCRGFLSLKRRRKHHSGVKCVLKVKQTPCSPSLMFLSRKSPNQQQRPSPFLVHPFPEVKFTAGGQQAASRSCLCLECSDDRQRLFSLVNPNNDLIVSLRNPWSHVWKGMREHTGDTTLAHQQGDMLSG